MRLGNQQVHFEHPNVRSCRHCPWINWRFPQLPAWPSLPFDKGGYSPFHVAYAYRLYIGFPTRASGLCFCFRVYFF